MTKLPYQQWKADEFRRVGFAVTVDQNFVISAVIFSYFVFALCLMHCVSCLVSDLMSFMSLVLSLAFACLVRCVSCLVSRLVFCASLVESLALCLVRCVFYLISCLLGSHSCSSVVDLHVFLLYIVSLDKELYIKPAVNQYRCFVWRH